MKYRRENRGSTGGLNSYINIRYAYMYSFDDQLQVPHIPEQDHSAKVSRES